jgi:DNA-binding beta-propeller fold protein YncE
VRIVCVSRRALNVWIAAEKSRAQSASRPGTTVHYVYVTNDASANVSAFAINASTGTLTQVKGWPFAAGPEPWGVAVDPTGKFAYVTNVSDGGKFADVTIAAGTDPYRVAIDPSGKFADVANACWGSAFDNISAYTIRRTGALVQVKGSPFEAGAGPVGLAIR